MTPADSAALPIPAGAGLARLKPHGVAVETLGASERRHEEVLLLVHGATCGSWFWEKAMPVFAAAGWDCAALNWRGHHLSEPMADDELAAVTLYDYVDDVDAVACALGRPVVVIGHSIGCVVVLKHAETGTVQPRGLVLLTAAPTAGAAAYDWPSVSPRRPVPPFTSAEARSYFFFDIDPEELDRYASLLCPESPLVVRDGGRALMDVAPHRVSGPLLVLGAQHDMMHGANGTIDWDLARHFGADYAYLRGVGHLPLLERRWRDGTDTILRWLERQFRYLTT